MTLNELKAECETFISAGHGDLPVVMYDHLSFEPPKPGTVERLELERRYVHINGEGAKRPCIFLHN